MDERHHAGQTELCPGFLIAPAGPQTLPDGAYDYGYGTSATGGAGGTEYIIGVEDDVDTLITALQTEGTRLITVASGTGRVFELASDLVVDHGDFTLDLNGARLAGAALRVDNASNFIIKNGLLARGNYPMVSGNTGDCLYVIGCSNFQIINNTLLWSVDELADFINCTDFTVRHNIFAEPLSSSLHSEAGHAYAVLVGGTSTRGTFAGNLFAHAIERTPIIAGGRHDIIDNVIYGCGHQIAISPESAACEVNVINNMLIANVSDELISPSGVRVVVSTYAQEVAVVNNIGFNRLDYTYGETLVVHAGERTLVTEELITPLSITPLACAEDAYIDVLASAGCVPRDSETLRVIENLVNRVGGLVVA
jgi:pectate lyase